MSDQKVILVTGAGGLLGNALQTICKSKKKEDETFIFVSSKDGNLENYDETKLLFEKYKPNYVINLAADVAGLFEQMKSNLSSFNRNFHIASNVMDCCDQYKVTKCISCLSICIFPVKAVSPIDETMLHDGPPSDENYGFCYAKRFIDIYSRALNEKNNKTIFVSVCPVNVYGPHDNFNLKTGHVLPCLIHKAYLSKQKSERLKVLGSGKAMRQFIYSYDVAELLLLTLREYSQPSTIILGVDPSQEISIKDAAEIIRKEFSMEKDLEFDTSFGDGQIKRTASNVKLRSIWPNFVFTSLEDGIHKTVKWLEKNYSNARI